MNIGNYIKMRREAAGMTIADVCSDAPNISLAMAALADRESGLVDATQEDLFQLWRIIGFCPDTAIAILNGQDPRICKSCGSSWQDACVNEHGETCHWVAMDSCSHCDVKVVV